MKLVTTILSLAALAMLALPKPAAAVNGAQVNKYLATGRSVQDVSETMIVPEEEVKKCQAEGASAAGGAPAPTPGAAPAK